MAASHFGPMRMYRKAPARRGTVPIGLGLFATKTIPKGTRVVGMDPARAYKLSRRAWRRFRSKSWPHDAAIERQGKMLSDFRHYARKPDWYFLNHKRRPNLEMKYVGGVIVWEAICRIPSGSELGFAYGDTKGCGMS